MTDEEAKSLAAKFFEDSPKPEAPSELLMPVKVVSREELKKLYPEPTKDAGASWWVVSSGDGLEIRFDADDGGIPVIEYAAYEKLERELAEAKVKKLTEVRYDLHEALTQERTKSAELYRALLLSHARDFTNHDPDTCMQPGCVLAREALAKWGKT